MGVAEVVDEAMPVTEFEIDIDGVAKPILDAPLEAPLMHEDAGDKELQEYLVRIEWLATRDREDAIWEKGMFSETTREKRESQ